jgi:2'-5' RNA ligase
MRLFLAAEISEEAREVLRRGLTRLRRDQPPARWVRPEAVHLTLKFLGEHEDIAVDALEAALRGELAALAPVTVTLGGGGFFPRPDRARVAWVGGSAPGLSTWAEISERCAAACGVPPENRPFSLHLTLARLERPWGARAVEHFLIEVGKWHFSPFECREITLFRSELHPSGAVYTALRRWTVG